MSGRDHSCPTAAEMAGESMEQKISRLITALAQAERERDDQAKWCKFHDAQAQRLLVERDSLAAQLAEAQDMLANIDHDRATHGHHSGCRINERRLREQLEELEEFVVAWDEMLAGSKIMQGYVKSHTRGRALTAARAAVGEVRKP